MADNKLYELLGVNKNATDSEIKKVNELFIYRAFSSTRCRVQSADHLVGCSERFCVEISVSLRPMG